jgi:hypothetical protein
MRHMGEAGSINKGCVQNKQHFKLWDFLKEVQVIDVLFENPQFGDMGECRKAPFEEQIEQEAFNHFKSGEIDAKFLFVNLIVSQKGFQGFLIEKETDMDFASVST